MLRQFGECAKRISTSQWDQRAGVIA